MQGTVWNLSRKTLYDKTLLTMNVRYQVAAWILIWSPKQARESRKDLVEFFRSDCVLSKRWVPPHTECREQVSHRISTLLPLFRILCSWMAHCRVSHITVALQTCCGSACFHKDNYALATDFATLKKSQYLQTKTKENALMNTRGYTHPSLICSVVSDLQACFLHVTVLQLYTPP